MTRAQQNLERPVLFVTAAKKVARLHGHRGHHGGWITNTSGRVICQGWDAYGHRELKRGFIAQDTEHDSGNGKWFVPVLHLTPMMLRMAELTNGRP